MTFLLNRLASTIPKSAPVTTVTTVTTATKSCTRTIQQTIQRTKTTSSTPSSSSSSSSSSKMTSAERNEALRQANEKMKFYYENRPSMEVLNKYKKKNNAKFGDDNRHFYMAGTISTFLCLFMFTPFLGKKIAQDEDFRKKYIPKIYDYSLEKPDYAWTRAELHEQMIQLQLDLHKRAINGEFTPEKLDEMRRHFDGVNPEEDEHGWGKLHPGVDDDEDIEDD